MISSQRNFTFSDKQVLLLLTASSFLVYFYFLHFPLLHLNSVLAGDSGDSLKNYFTFAFHSKHDDQFLNFKGFNYPFGEHSGYTDCQLLITFFLHYLPFTHDYLAGILNTLIFFSLIITPLILFNIFSMTGVQKWPAFFSALAIAVLSPQYYKIYAGHYALAYTCIIPFTILLLLRVMSGRKWAVLILTLSNLCIFFIHPYLGIGTALFSLLTLFIVNLSDSKRRKIYLSWTGIFYTGLLPPLVFMLFMHLTDHHLGRSSEPFGLDIHNATPGSLLLCYTGPFREFCVWLFRTPFPSPEAYSYLGLFLIFLCSVFILLLPFFFRRLKIRKDSSALMFASVFLLILAFGAYYYFSRRFHIRISALEQLRAPGRFAWFFYYMLPLFVLPLLFSLFSFSPRGKTWSTLLAIIFFAFNLTEGAAVIQPDQNVWNRRNIFNPELLIPAERALVRTINSQKLDAIIPVPFFHNGSEFYQRGESDFGMQNPVLLSFHTGLPIFANSLSRTSLVETAKTLNMLCSYEQLDLIEDDAVYLVVLLPGPLRPDELRFLKAVRFFYKNEKASYGILKASEWKAARLPVSIVRLNKEEKYTDGKQNLIYLPFEEKKPFLTANTSNYEKFFELDANTVAAGRYAVSLHYHFMKKDWPALECNLIISRGKGDAYEWKYNLGLRSASAAYQNYFVYEDVIDIEPGCRYEFMMKGTDTVNYHISNFMLRPLERDFMMTGTDTLLNNFPLR